MLSTKVNLYATKYSPPCQAVLMTAKALGIILNMKDIDLTAGQHLSEDYLKINPAHTVPSIEDDGFILTESRAIMRYLCNSYGEDSPLYPRNTKQRALIDQLLDFDNFTFNVIKDAIAKPLFGFAYNEEKMNVLKDNLKVMDTIVGNKKFLIGDHLTIADLSVLATTHMLLKLGPDLKVYPNFKRWLTEMMTELEAFNEYCDIDLQEMMSFIQGMQTLFTKLKEQTKEETRAG